MPKSEVLSTRAFRLAVAFALTISLATMAVFGTIYVLVRRQDASRISAILAYEVSASRDADEETLRKALAARQTKDIRRIDYMALFDANGRRVLGNLAQMPDVPIDGSGHFVYPRAFVGENATNDPAIIVAGRRPDGGILFIGRDLSQSLEIQFVLLRVLAAALIPTVALTLAIGVLFARRASQRLLSVQDAITRIIEGDLGSRLPISRDNDAIDHVASAVNVMLEEIARLLDQLKSVGDNIAHDLRSPLAVARAKLERALEASENAGLDLPPLLSSAIAQLDRAAVTIDALLRISTVEAGKRERPFGDVDLAQVCRDTFEFFEPVADQKSVALRVDAANPVWIRGDLDLVREAVANLVDNAIKFTPERGEVAIVCGVKDNAPFLEVSDTGPGIPMHEREKVFRRFYRGECSPDAAGHGLGLSIAQTIAQLHGFDLRAEDGAAGARLVMRRVAPHV